MIFRRTSIFLSIAFSSVVTTSIASASVIGTLGNFDVINDTGKTAHGFEIDLEGIHSYEVTDVFGGPGRGFPTGRGFDPSTSVERYGSPTITEYTTGTTFGTKITYEGIFDGTNWDYGTPSGTFITPGDNCWSGGGLGYGADTPCDHFGVGTSKEPTHTTYSWLVETGTPGVLTNGIVILPTPSWQVIPSPIPDQPPQVIAKVEAPEPGPGQEFGDAIWVEVFTTELEGPVELEDLVGGSPVIEQAETEIEWQLLQKEIGNPLSGILENESPVGANAESIIRRYEFYEFSGNYDPETHEALFGVGFGDTNPGPNDVGHYLGAQNGAVNLVAAPVPEPSTYLMLLTGVSLLAGVRKYSPNI